MICSLFRFRFRFCFLAALLLLGVFLSDIHLLGGQGQPWWNSLVYQLCHDNIFHLLANVYCLFLILRGGFHIGVRRCAFAYGISIAASLVCLPTQGFSGILYALFGMVSWQSSRIRLFHAWMLPLILVGFLFPNMSAMLHLLCYIAGVAIDMMFVPWRERLRRYWN